MSQAFSEKKSSGEYRKPKKGLADKIAADPTSVFLSSLRHTHPDALKALAVWCKNQESQDKQHTQTQPAKKHDQTSVIQAMEGLKRVGSATASRLSAIKKEDENLIELESLTAPAHLSTSLDETADYPTIAYAHMEASVARELIEEKAQAAAAAYSGYLAGVRTAAGAGRLQDQRAMGGRLVSGATARRLARRHDRPARRQDQHEEMVPAGDRRYL